MKSKLRELRDAKRQLVEKSQALLDRAKAEGRDLTEQEWREHRENVAGAKDLQSKIDALEDHQDLEAEINEPGPRVSADPIPGSGLDPLRSGESAAEGFQIIGRELDTGRPVYAVRNDQRVADLAGEQNLPGGLRVSDVSLGNLIVGRVTGNWRNREAEAELLAATGVTGDSAGHGFSVPSALSRQFIDLARANSTVIQAGVLTVPMTTQELKFTKLEQDIAVAWKAEGATLTAGVPNFGAIRMRAKTCMGLASIGVETFEDSPNAGQIVEHSLAQAIGLEVDRVVLVGQGAAEEPLGLYYEPDHPIVELGANGGVLGYDDLSQASQKVYENNGSPLAAIMSAREWGLLDREKDGEGHYDGGPRSWEALRKLVTTQIPTDLSYGTASDASFLPLGDWRAAALGMRTNVSIEASRVAGDAFGSYTILLRATIRVDTAFFQPGHLCTVVAIVAP